MIQDKGAVHNLLLRAYFTCPEIRIEGSVSTSLKHNTATLPAGTSPISHFLPLLQCYLDFPTAHGLEQNRLILAIESDGTIWAV